jgi:hypothetical protein
MALRPLERRFSWSVSRDRLMRTCARAYYYHYYGAWGGWEPGAPPAARELYVLRHLSTRHQWVGSMVHQVLEAVLVGLRERRPMRREEAGERLTNLMRFRWRRSRAGAYREAPKLGGLLEHEYGVPVRDADWRALHDGAQRALAAAYTLGIFERLAAIGREDWLGVERLDSFELDGVPVYAVPDVAFREGGRVVIVDWKTGGEDDVDALGVRFQLLCYGLYARARLGATPEGLRVGAALLGAPSYQEGGVAGAELDAALGRIRASMLEMRSRLADRAADVAREEEFPRTTDERRCAACPFRRPCRGLAWEAPAA